MKIDIKEIESKTGYKVAEVNGYLIHSKYNPIKEAQLIAQESLEQNYLHILHGYGYGYILEELIKNLDEGMQLVLYDANLLQAHLLKEIIKKENILFFENIRELEVFIGNQLSSELDRKIKVITSPNYDKIFVEEHASLLKIIKDLQMENVVTENTLKFFVEQWQENYIMNLRALAHQNSLEILKEKHSLPVVVASGGPSLTKQIPLLRNIIDNIILIASGSTINSLLAEGIEPDYVVSLDGSLKNYEHFKSLGNIKSKLIFALSSHYKIQEEYKNPQYAYIYSNEEALQQDLKKSFNINLPLINAGGTVATAAMHIATYISTQPVALIGQDLAYTNNETHAKNNLNYNAINEDLLKMKGAFKVEGYYGEDVYTDYAFLSMKKAFNSIYSLICEKNEIFNCTEGGIKIENIPQISFKQFIQNYVSVQTLKDTIEFEKIEGFKLNKHKVLLDKINKELGQYDELIILLKKCLRQIGKANKFQVFSQEILDKVDLYDEEIKHLFNEVRMQQITELLIVSVIRDYKKSAKNETREEQFNRVYKQNKVLYEKLLDYAKKSKKFTLNVQAKLLEDLKGFDERNDK